MSKFSDEGTAAHSLAAMCLNDTRTALAYLGRIIEVTDGRHSRLSPSKAQMHLTCVGSAAMTRGLKEDVEPQEARKFEVDQEMAGYVQTYVDTINSRVEEYIFAGASSAVLHVEQHVPVDHITGEEGGGGSADAIIVVTWPDDSVLLDVNDLKYGKGVVVSAAGNEQMRLYALGAARKLKLEVGQVTKVRMSIHQPRVREAPDEEEITWNELVAWGAWAIQRYDEVRDAEKFSKNWIRDGSTAYLEPGEKQCKFCLAKSRCPALASFVTATVEADFKVLAEAVPLDAVDDQTVAVKVPTDNDQLAQKMLAIDLIEEWCKAIRAEVERRLVQGIGVPQYKLVQGKKGNREWADDAAAEAAMKSMRLRKEDMYDMSLISPPTAEKKFKKEAPKRWSRLQKLITQREGKAHVAHVSDPRPALSVAPTTDDFADETGGDLLQ